MVSRKKPRWPIWLAVIGAIAFVGLLERAGPAEVWRASLGAGWGLLAVLLVPLGFFLLHTAAWVVLLPDRLRPGFGPAFLAYIASQSLDELGGGLLGEPIKLAVVPGSTVEGAVAVSLDNISLLASLLLSMVLVALLLTTGGKATVSVGTLLLGALVTLVFGGLLLAFLLSTPTRGLGLLARLLPGTTGHSLQKGYNEMVVHNRRYFASHWPRFLAGTGLHFLAKSWLVVELWVTLWVLGYGDFGAGVWLGVGQQVMQAAAAAVPAQAGAFEASMVVMGEAVGLTASAAMAVALLRRARSLFWITIGLLLTMGSDPYG